MKDILMGLIKRALETFVTDEMVEQAKKWLIAHLRELALKTDNDLDDAMVDILEKALS